MKLAKFTFIPLLAFSSCATVFDTDQQQVQLLVASDVSADCSITYRDGTEENVQIPSAVTLMRSYYPIEINCFGGNGERGSATVYSDVSNWGYGGAVLGTAIGAGVDTYTGAAFEFPEEIIIELGKQKVLGKTSLNSNVNDEERW